MWQICVVINTGRKRGSRNPTISGALLLPPPLFLCMQRPSRRPFVCLGACIVTSTEALVFERLLRNLGITGPPGELLPYWDQIPYTRFLFDF